VEKKKKKKEKKKNPKNNTDTKTAKQKLKIAISQRKSLPEKKIYTKRNVKTAQINYKFYDIIGMSQGKNTNSKKLCPKS
jgi:hypothetical protein